MDLLAPVHAFDRFQRRHTAFAVPVAVIKKFSDDTAGNGAALIAYWGFFSIFPLLLLLVAGLGFVLHGNPDAQKAVLDSALSQFPAVGEDLRAGALKGSGIGLGIGIVGTLVSGLGVTVHAQNALNRVYHVPRYERPNFIKARLRGLAILGTLGLLQIISTVASGLVAGGLGKGVGLTLAGIVISLAINIVLFFAAFRLLTDDSVPTREMWPGIVMASVLWEILQAVGGIYVGHVVKGAESSYGTFAIVIGLLTWLYLGARVLVYSAEMNTVVARRLYPRSLLGPPELPADREVLRTLAQMEECREGEDVEVRFADAAARERPPGES